MSKEKIEIEEMLSRLNGQKGQIEQSILDVNHSINGLQKQIKVIEGQLYSSGIWNKSKTTKNIIRNK